MTPDEFKALREANLIDTKAGWLERGYRVLTKFQKAPVYNELRRIPGYGEVPRYWFDNSQVVKIDEEARKKRAASAAKAVSTRIANMCKAMQEVEITIVTGVSDEKIQELARSSYYNRNERADAHFIFTNRAAQNCIRHNLTNYEELWTICNRGNTGSPAYDILRERVDKLVKETYPQFADEYAMPKII